MEAKLRALIETKPCLASSILVRQPHPSSTTQHFFLSYIRFAIGSQICFRRPYCTYRKDSGFELDLAVMADPLYELLAPYFDSVDARSRPPPPTSDSVTSKTPVSFTILSLRPSFAAGSLESVS
ncbi:predicted protein [Histoplasma capsulatum H143]|uniref:Uncharacterized protein n=1 Tax=Ajellomyces capsulatus (strain H143) TaxID=544712 RepID=C6HRS9_AJECH|nr:predicted protein [Histoplasma capsulatum H143]